MTKGVEIYKAAFGKRKPFTVGEGDGAYEGVVFLVNKSR